MDIVTELRRPEAALTKPHKSLGDLCRQAAVEIERLRADLAGVDAVLFYYIAKDWPSYTEREREGKTWRPEMMEHQNAAMARHSERRKRALEQKAGDNEQ